jgi:hypothetical protein
METEDSVKSDQKVELSSQTTTTNTTPVPSTLAASSTSNITPAATTTSTTTTKTKLPSIVLPEVDLYLNLLVLLFAIDRQKYKSVK